MRGFPEGKSTKPGCCGEWWDRDGSGGEGPLSLMEAIQEEGTESRRVVRSGRRECDCLSRDQSLGCELRAV